MPRLVSIAFFLAASVLNAAEFPPPVVDIPTPSTKQTASVVLAGGCFWGVEAVFERLKGVSEADSGYAGGYKYTAHYEIVETGLTGHAESVKVSYDPSQISFGKLLEVFFSVAHAPPQLNRQGPDLGTQYRSVIFYSSDEQKRVAEAYIKQLNEAKVYSRPIVTQITALEGFYRAEEYHQHYLDHNPDQPYIVFNDLPKLKHLKEQFPELLRHR